MQFIGTTILAIKKNGKVAIAGDGQVTLNTTVMKNTAKKVRKLNDGKVVAGFAGSAADAITLLEKFENKLKEFNGILSRAAVELARDWRTDKYLRKLEALMIVADNEKMFLVSGTGDVIEPDENIIAIGSGGSFALAAAKVYDETTDLSASEIALKSLQIAASICIYTNDNITVETLE